jgi:hypothetical protein
MTALVRRGDLRKFDFDKRAVGFWMEVDGDTPPRFIRVFVTHEALSSIDPDQPPDFHGALATFDNNRDRIDRAASLKFTSGKVADGLHEGQPVIILRDMDI